MPLSEQTAVRLALLLYEIESADWAHPLIDLETDEVDLQFPLRALKAAVKILKKEINPQNRKQKLKK